jgi:hypothetical protein
MVGLQIVIPFKKLQLILGILLHVADGVCLRSSRFLSFVKINNNAMIFQLKHCSELCRITVPAEERVSELLIQSPVIFTFQWNEIFLGLSRPVELLFSFSVDSDFGGLS